MQETPVYDRTSHDLFHCDIADPACGFCDESWARQQHPSSLGVAARREAEQHRDFEAQAQAVVDAKDTAVLRRRMWIFTICAAFFTPIGIILTIVVDPPAGRILSGLVALAGIATAVAAWDLHHARQP